MSYPVDHVNAFKEIFTVTEKSTGFLAGLTAGVKDLFNVKGYSTACGNPKWLETHHPATDHGSAVKLLLDNGAKLVGKTHTDELAYSLLGNNHHYGTPINSAAPDRLPGGSSSGSAAAVCAGLVDIGLGTDTGGSIRIPASFCGLFGLRTSHGKIPMDGVMPLAPSFDSAGWLTRDIDTLIKVAISANITAKEKFEFDSQLLIPEDLWQCADPTVATKLRQTVQAMETIWGSAETISLADGQLDKWRETFQICQGAEIWQCHKDWIKKYSPTFGPGVKERFNKASLIPEETWQKAMDFREDITATMSSKAQNAVLVIPSSPTIAPYKNDTQANLEYFRDRALNLLSPAGLAKCPQLSIPAGLIDGAPIGISLVGTRGSDLNLLNMTKEFIEKTNA